MGSKPSRDSWIEVLRFILAMIVVMVHTNGLQPKKDNYPFVGGHLAVGVFSY